MKPKYIIAAVVILLMAGILILPRQGDAFTLIDIQQLRALVVELRAKVAALRAKIDETRKQQVIILVVDKSYYDDKEIASKVERYTQDNPGYRFITLFFNKTDDAIKDASSPGGDVKKNSLELRNAIKQISHSDPQIIGVFVIGNIRPTIWRDARLWRGLGADGFYPSMYPLLALDSEHYSGFDVAHDGFYEKAGETKGSEVGGGYSVSLWGAALIPPTFNLDLGKKLVGSYLDRDHDYRIQKISYDKKMLYTSTFGCSSSMVGKVNENSLWQQKANIILCPNFHESLLGFDSLYRIGIEPSVTAGKDEQEEFDAWISKDYFGNSRLTHSVPSWSQDIKYNYTDIFLHLKGRSMSEAQIRNVLEKNLPLKFCNRTKNCKVHVTEFNFEESDGSNWDGAWKSYPDQQWSWARTYKEALENNKVQFTYVNAHGSPTFHQFAVDSFSVQHYFKFSSMIYEFESCNAGNYLVENYIAGNYLFYGNALAVSAYSIPIVLQGTNGYLEGPENTRFLNVEYGKPVIDALFLKNYGNYLYLGDPLLTIPQ